MRLLNALLAVVLLCSATANAAPKVWKLQELARASNALLVEMDELLAHKKSACKLDAAGVSQASQNLKALIDERVVQLSEQKDQVLKLMKTCKKDCSCDTYEYALEKMTGSETGTTQTKFSASERKTCAKTFGLCTSKLFKAIK